MAGLFDPTQGFASIRGNLPMLDSMNQVDLAKKTWDLLNQPLARETAQLKNILAINEDQRAKTKLELEQLLNPVQADMYKAQIGLFNARTVGENLNNQMSQQQLNEYLALNDYAKNKWGKNLNELNLDQTMGIINGGGSYGRGMPSYGRGKSLAYSGVRGTSGNVSTPTTQTTPTSLNSDQQAILNNFNALHQQMMNAVDTPSYDNFESMKTNTPSKPIKSFEDLKEDKKPVASMQDVAAALGQNQTMQEKARIADNFLNKVDETKRANQNILEAEAKETKRVNDQLDKGILEDSDYFLQQGADGSYYMFPTSLVNEDNNGNRVVNNIMNDVINSRGRGASIPNAIKLKRGSNLNTDSYSKNLTHVNIISKDGNIREIPINGRGNGWTPELDALKSAINIEKTRKDPKHDSEEVVKNFTISLFNQAPESKAMTEYKNNLGTGTDVNRKKVIHSVLGRILGGADFSYNEEALKGMNQIITKLKNPNDVQDLLSSGAFNFAGEKAEDVANLMKIFAEKKIFSKNETYGKAVGGNISFSSAKNKDHSGVFFNIPQEDYISALEEYLKRKKSNSPKLVTSHLNRLNTQKAMQVFDSEFIKLMKEKEASGLGHSWD